LELQSESIGLPRKTFTRPFCKKISATIVEKEQQKLADAEARIKVLEEQLKGLK